MPLHAVGSALGVFIVCTGIDIVRIKLVETPLLSIWDKDWPQFSSRFIRIEEKICEKLKIVK